LKTTFVTLPKGGEVRDTQTLEPKIGIFMGLFNSPPLCFEFLLIGVEGAKTPAGAAGQVRPRRSKATRRLSASPAESEAPGTEINSSISLQTKNRRIYTNSIFI
jgi:hypothetical protein